MNIICKLCQAILIAMLLIQPNVFAGDIHVSPTGSSTNKGTLDSPLDIHTAFSEKSPARPGDTLLLHAGLYELKDDKKNPFEIAISGEAGKPIQVQPLPGKIAQLNGPLTLSGSHLRFIGIEIGLADWDPMKAKTITYHIRHSSSIMGNRSAKKPVISRDVKLINCNLFGSYGGGVFLGTNCIDYDLYGCLIHDCGSGGRSTTPLDIGELTIVGGMHGPGYKGSNKEGTQLLQHNIFYRTCGESIAVTTGGLEGFDLIENICSIAGALHPAQTRDNIMICGNYGKTESPIDRMRMIGNVAYQPSDLYHYKSNVRLTNYKPIRNETAVVKDNYWMGAYNGFTLGMWNDLRMTDNTIWATGLLVSTPAITMAPPGAKKGNVVDKNHYIPGSIKSPFEYDGKVISFEEWQQQGLDKNGSVLRSKDGKPTGTKIFVFPNKYEKGRGNIGIFNWDGHDAVEVDLSTVLKIGQQFKIYNVLDIKGSLAGVKPVVQDKATGKKVKIPMRRDIMSPDFDAFLVLSQNNN